MRGSPTQWRGHLGSDTAGCRGGCPVARRPQAAASAGLAARRGGTARTLFHRQDGRCHALRQRHPPSAFIGPNQQHSAGRLVHLDLTTPGMTLLSVTRGASLQPDRVLPLYAGKVHVGQLSLAVRPGLEPLGRADERLLDALGHVLASSAYNLGLQQALRKALAQAVTAREEERRHIRREIHDGIGPLLAAALLRTETAMELPPGCASQAESPTEAACLAADRTDGRSQPGGRTPPTSPRPWRPAVGPSAARGP